MERRPSEASAGDRDPDAAFEDKPVHERFPSIRVIGFPGSFTAWGVGLVRQVLELAGTAIEILPLDQAPALGAIPLAGWGATVRVLLTHGPMLGHADILPGEESRTIVFLDDPARALGELLATGAEAAHAVRVLTATLAPLASVVLEPGVLMVRRTAGMTGAATLQAIAAHLMPTLSPAPTAVWSNGAVDEAETAVKAPDTAIDLARQALAPLINLVGGATREPIFWPLSCFYWGDHPGEAAPPIVDLLGPRRTLYYGPYFHVPRGRWRVDVQLFFSDDVRDTNFVIDVVTGMHSDVELAKVWIRPPGGGLFLASFPAIIERPEEKIEIRVRLDRGAIEGQVGLRQVALHPADADGQ